jgi:hypothetical protein
LHRYVGANAPRKESPQPLGSGDGRTDCSSGLAPEARPDLRNNSEIRKAALGGAA